MWSWIYAFRVRLRAIVNRERDERALQDELSFHVAMQTRANQSHGMTRAEAERQARLALGGVQQLKENLHDQRSIPWFDHLGQDVRFGIRVLRRTKAMSAAIIVTFALGIGANTAIFSLINGVLLSPLPYETPDRIVAVEPFWTNRGVSNVTSSDPDFRDWQAQNRVFEHLAYHAGGRSFRVAVRGAPSFASVQLITLRFFDVFGMKPAAGRVWNESESNAPVAVVSHRWAQSQFGEAGAAVGQPLEVIGRIAEIVGVASPGFTYPNQTDIWVPSTLFPTNPNRGGHNYIVVGKLKAGIELQEARRDMQAIAARLEKTYPENRFKSVAVTPMLDKLTSGAQTTLWLLFGTVLGVLLIACVNVAHLQLARTAARAREMAVRSAIGAAPGRIARQVLTENVVVGAAGAGVGLLVGWATLNAFLAIAPADIPRLDEVRINTGVFLFMLVATFVCSLLFGVSPARRAARSGATAGLRQQPTRRAGSVAPRVRATLVIAEVALSLVLLVASGLLLRSFVQLSQVDLGFATDRLLVTTMAYPIARGPVPDPRATAFYRDVVKEVRNLPGVVQAAGVRTMPFERFRADSGYTIDGGRTYRQGEGPLAQIQIVTPGYFVTMSTPIRQGRDFSDEDEYGRPQVAIINERLARETFGSGNPLGKIIRTGMTEESSMGMEIVGVVADARQLAPEVAAQAEIYLPYRQHPGPGAQLSLLVRTSLAPESLSTAIRETSRRLNPGVPVRFSTMEAVLNEALSYPRFRALLVGAFALLAMFLALVGIYSVLSYLVAEQTSEIGVRLALGALRRDIFGGVIGGSMRLVAAGLALGLAISLLVVQALQTMLFDVSARDPITIAAVVALMIVTALAASGIPALRAASVDPLVALRDE